MEGCSVIARDAGGRILLVRHSYGPPVWAFPGGGVGRKETALNAAAREMREELGVTLVGTRRVALFKEAYLGGTNKVHLFVSGLEGEPRADGREILEARFFSPDALPGNSSSTIKHRMDLLDALEAGQEQALRKAPSQAPLEQV